VREERRVFEENPENGTIDWSGQFLNFSFSRIKPRAPVLPSARFSAWLSRAEPSRVRWRYFTASRAPFSHPPLRSKFQRNLSPPLPIPHECRSYRAATSSESRNLPRSSMRSNLLPGVAFSPREREERARLAERAKIGRGWNYSQDLFPRYVTRGHTFLFKPLSQIDQVRDFPRRAFIAPYARCVSDVSPTLRVEAILYCRSIPDGMPRRNDLDRKSYH